MLNKLFSRLFIIVALGFLVLSAVHPFAQGQMLRTDDGSLHLYRTMALDLSLRHDNTFYPRYSSTLAYGYGAPLFNYFPPTAYYLPWSLNQIGRILVDDFAWVDAWLASMIVIAFIAAAGAYLLGTSWSNRFGGFVAAAAFVYAPYMLFNTITRGTLTEAMALAFLPWVLWALHRVVVDRRRMDFVVAVVLYALFIITHNVVTLLGTAFIATYCLVLVAQSRHPLGDFVRLLLVGITAIVMTAFFWLPALGEVDVVRINSIADELPFIDATRSLRSLVEILSLPQTADPRQLQFPVPITLSWVQIVLSLVGLVVALFRRHRLRGMLIFLLISSTVLVALNLEPSAFVWRSVPLLSYSQFAWRTLGIASLALALMTGLSMFVLIDLVRLSWLKIGLFCGVLLLNGLYGIPWLYTLYIDLPSAAVNDIHNHERETQQVALSSYGEYVPNSVAVELDTQKLITRFEDNEIISRLVDVPRDVRILDSVWTGTSGVVDMFVEAPTAVEFDWVYVPGWRAELEGRDRVVEVTPSIPEGLVRVDLPSGNVRLHIWLEATSLQITSWQISAVGVVLLVILVAGWRRSEQPETQQMQIGQPIILCIAVMVTGLGLFFFKATVVDHANTVFRQDRLATQRATGSIIDHNAVFNSDIRLIGSTTPQRIETGLSEQIKLFWSLQGGEVDTQYSSAIKLYNADGLEITTTTAFIPGGLATDNWIPDTYLEDVLRLDIPSSTPPGQYTLTAGLFDTVSLSPANYVDPLGNPIGVDFEIATIEITRSAMLDGAPNNATLLADSGIGLGEFNLPTTTEVGAELLIEFPWVAQQLPSQDYIFRLAWLGEDGTVQGYSSARPLTAGYATSQWQQGDFWVGTHRLYVPGNLTNGSYEIGVQLLVDDMPITDVISLTKPMQITAPLRSFDVPQMQAVIDAEWQNGITLFGYDLGDDDRSVLLFWQPQMLLDESLILFVHLLDENDNILALTNGVPASNTRPTTGWAPNEIITTQHNFDMPVMPNRLRIGWYQPPNTDDRESLINGTDLLILDPCEDLQICE